MDKGFLTTLLKAMVCVAKCDNHIDEEEVIVLKKFAEKHEITSVEIPSVGLIEPSNKQTILSIIESLIDNFSDDIQQDYIVDCLSQVADADNELHPVESEILKLLDKKIGAEISFTKSPSEDWSLNQRKIVESESNDRILVDAPPGAGKTTLIAHRIHHLIENCDVEPSNIWLISFTRIAVKEMRDKFFLFASNYPTGIRIATLDSTAYLMNMSVTDDKNNILDYEKNIEDFIHLLSGQNADIIDFIENLEHVIIDEAQDLVGLRKDLCIELIKAINNDCGVTIFGDNNQKIYSSWSTGNDSSNGEINQSLQENNFINDNFKILPLDEIHRTSSPILLNLIEDLRIDLLVYDEHSSEDLQRRRNIIINSAKSVNRQELMDKAASNSLILFRTNAEVISSMINLILAGRKFRIRSPRYPRYIHTWLNVLLNYIVNKNYPNQIMPLQDIDPFINTLSSRDSKGINPNLIVEHLKQYAFSNGGISLAMLRERLSKINPPPEFQKKEYGFTGPILGTVHSSKGSESDNVYFALPKNKKSKNYDEESRILFVGASRAKKTLNILSDDNLKYRDDWHPVGRKGEERYAKIFVSPKSDNKMAFVEIGRAGDFDPYSIVSKSIGNTEARRTQEFLGRLWPTEDVECLAKYNIQDSTYQIFANHKGEEYCLGKLKSSFADNMLYISKRLWKYKYQPPLIINNLEIIDISTFVVSVDNPKNSQIIKSFSDSGTWFCPVICGIRPVQFGVH